MTSLIKQKAEILVVSNVISCLLAVFIFLAAIFYMYFANATVRALTVLEKTKEQMQSLSVKVSEMESQRLLAENSLSVKTAEQLGLVEVHNPTFITKSAKKAALSLKMD